MAEEQKEDGSSTVGLSAGTGADPAGAAMALAVASRMRADEARAQFVRAVTLNLATSEKAELAQVSHG